MGRLARSFVPVALTLTICREATTQQFDSLPIDSGTVTRIHVTRTRPVEGRLLQTFTPSSSALTFCHYPGPSCATLSDQHAQTVPVAQVLGLEVHHGTQPLKGALIGGAVSLPLAWSVGTLSYGACDAGHCLSSSRLAALSVLGLGLGIGAFYGSAWDRWRWVRW